MYIPNSWGVQHPPTGPGRVPPPLGGSTIPHQGEKLLHNYYMSRGVYYPTLWGGALGGVVSHPLAVCVFLFIILFMLLTYRYVVV